MSEYAVGARTGTGVGDTSTSNYKPNTATQEMASLLSNVAHAKTDDANHVAINNIGNLLNGGNTGTNTGGFQA